MYYQSNLLFNGTPCSGIVDYFLYGLILKLAVLIQETGLIQAMNGSLVYVNASSKTQELNEFGTFHLPRMKVGAKCISGELE